MTCDAFDRRLDALLDGRCSPREWREAEAHLSGCARCRRVLDAVSGRAGDLDDAGHLALVQSILERTGGNPCGAARGLLCDFVDGALGGLDRELVTGHLDRCPACARLAAALLETTAALASFTALAPRRSVVAGVLAATSRRAGRVTRVGPVAAWLGHTATRPRFSLEAAYVLTVLLLMVFGNPVNAFKEATVRVRPHVGLAAAAVSGPIDRLRSTGMEKVASVERTISARPGPSAGIERRPAKLWQPLETRVGGEARKLVSRVGARIVALERAAARALGLGESEPPSPTAR